MEEVIVNEIDVPFVALKVVALGKKLGREDMLLADREEIVVREKRRLSRTEIGEYDSGFFDARIHWMANRVSLRAAARLAGLIQAAAMNVIEPAVIDAAKPAVFHASIAQVRSSMRTVKSQQAGPALIVAKKNQFLTEEPYG